MIPNISAPRSASSACSIPGARSWNIIPMSTASLPPADCPSITRAGSPCNPKLSFLPAEKGTAEACSAPSSRRLSRTLSQKARSSSTANCSISPIRRRFTPSSVQLFRHDWVVHCKRPFGGPEHVLRYLGRYTHRVAISNHRLVSFTDGKVTFLWRDRAHGNREQPMTLPADEFLRRFLLHLLPKGFVRIRNFGFLANRRRRVLLSLCFQYLGSRDHTSETETQATETPGLWRCPKCGGPMIVTLRVNLPIHSPPRASVVWE